MYLANDRPDVQITVNELACAMSKPTKAALEASKHLTRHLLKTRGFGIHFPCDWDGADDPIVYTDSDWAGDKATRKCKSAAHGCWASEPSRVGQPTMLSATVLGQDPPPRNPGAVAAGPTL